MHDTHVFASVAFAFLPADSYPSPVWWRLERGLGDELQEYWDVEIAEWLTTGSYCWGFVKLEPFAKVGADLLAFFERIYHQRLPVGHTRRVLARDPQ